MPSLFAPSFPDCIKNLPVLPHSVEVDAAFWGTRLSGAGLEAMHQAIFAGQPSFRITRDRLLNHSYADPRQKCVEILLWGYRKNERGIPTGLFPHLHQLVKASTALVPWEKYRKGFPKGAGASTVTKLAYFFQCSFNGQQALILDNRLVGQIARWTPLNSIEGSSSDQMYLGYLAAMHATASQLGCSGEQLELFLFSMGANY